jgi:hypothetical protein
LPHRDLQPGGLIERWSTYSKNLPAGDPFALKETMTRFPIWVTLTLSRKPASPLLTEMITREWQMYVYAIRIDKLTVD